MAAAVMRPSREPLTAPLIAGPPLAVDVGRRQLTSVLQLGRQCMQDGQFEKAIPHFTLALDLKPGLVHALVSRGFCFLSLGDEERAQQDFTEVIAKDAGFNRNVYVLIALCLKRRGDFVTAIRYLGRCIVQFPTFRPALLARGELSLKVRQYEKARMDFRQILKNCPTHLAARRGLGDSSRGLGDLREAMRHYTKAIEDAEAALTSGGQRQGSRIVTEGSENSYADDAMVDAVEDDARNHASANAMHEDSNDDGLDLRDQDSDVGSSGRQIIEVVGSTEEGSSDRFQEEQVDDVTSAAVCPENLVILQDEPVQSRAQLQAFIMEVLLRRALLLRIAGDLEGSGSDLLDILQQDPQHGLALFWYGKLLIEQHRHKEATAFLQASAQHYEETRAACLALLGMLLLTSPEPDCQTAVRHLREAARLTPQSQPIRVTQWICAAAAALTETPQDSRRCLGLLDRSLAALGGIEGSSSSAAAGPPNSARASSAPSSARGSVHVAGSAGLAVVGLTKGSSPEECCWKTARSVVKRRQELAQGSDLDLALDCTTFLQLVAKTPQQQGATIPPLLFAMRAVALCDLGRWEECVADCRRALALDPEDEVTQYNMHLVAGVVKSRSAEFEAAVGRFTKSVRLRPVSGEARVHRAVALFSCAKAQLENNARANSVSGRALQLFADAVQDLEAAQQQAHIVGTLPPVGTARLLAACLCGLGRVQEAWDALKLEGRHDATLDAAQRLEACERGSTLEAEILVMLGQHGAAIAACSELISSDDAAQRIGAYSMRSRCWAELGEPERAFEDCREALILAPERSDIHEASGELFLAYGCYSEAITALSTAAKLGGSLTPRLAYLRALASLAMGNSSAATKEFGRTLRLNPNLPIAIRARDGVSALTMILEGDFRTAHVRLNVLIHARLQGSGLSGQGAFGAGLGSGWGNLPLLFQPYELLLYRGVCAMYLGEVDAAIQDFHGSFELARQLFDAEAVATVGGTSGDVSSQRQDAASGSGRHATTSNSSFCSSSMPQQQSAFALAGLDTSLSSQEPMAARQRRLAPEVATRQGLECYECEMLYNVALCQLMARDYHSANVTGEKLLQNSDALTALGRSSQCLAWFLLGICRLALGEASSDSVREAFMHSYAYDPIYVDDFLRRHEPRNESGGMPGPAGHSAMGGGGTSASAVPRRVGGPVPPSALSRVGGPVRPVAPCESCDSAPEAVACLRKIKAALGSRLPPRRIHVKDVVVWCRASAPWPFVAPPNITPRGAGATPGISLTNVGSLGLPGHLEVGVNALPPWEKLYATPKNSRADVRTTRLS